MRSQADQLDACCVMVTAAKVASIHEVPVSCTLGPFRLTTLIIVRACALHSGCNLTLHLCPADALSPMVTPFHPHR
jgi:hypothetical protein